MNDEMLSLFFFSSLSVYGFLSSFFSGSGAISYLYDTQTNVQYASPTNAIGEYVYTTFTEDDVNSKGKKKE